MVHGSGLLGLGFVCQPHGSDVTRAVSIIAIVIIILASITDSENYNDYDYSW